MSKSLPVLVIMTAGNCGACQALKKVWPDMKKKIEETGLVTIVEADRPSMKDKLGSEFPSDLNRYSAWFPMFILFDGKEWAAGGTLNGVVFHGKVETGQRPEYSKNTKYSMKAEGLIEWIKDHLDELNTSTKTNTFALSSKTETKPVFNLPTVGPSVAPLLKANTIQPLVPKVANPTQGKPDLKSVVMGNGQVTAIKTVTGSTTYVGTEELINTCQSFLQTRRRDNP